MVLERQNQLFRRPGCLAWRHSEQATAATAVMAIDETTLRFQSTTLRHWCVSHKPAPAGAQIYNDNMHGVDYFNSVCQHDGLRVLWQPRPADDVLR